MCSDTNDTQSVTGISSQLARLEEEINAAHGPRHARVALCQHPLPTASALRDGENLVESNHVGQVTQDCTSWLIEWSSNQAFCSPMPSPAMGTSTA